VLCTVHRLILCSSVVS